MKVFGADLDQVLIQERLLGLQTSTGVPTLVDECLKFLIPAHAQEEGLFRISGMKEEILALKLKVDTSAAQAVPFRIESEFNCHNVSGLLKLYIRELPSPLYPKAVHQELIAAGKEEDEKERTTKLQTVAKQLPLSNFVLLKTLTCALKDLLINVDTTKMTAANLSTVWAPNLIWDRETEIDPTTCLAFSRDINLAIQYTIEAAYDMFASSEEVSSLLPAVQEGPKRKSVFDLEPVLLQQASSSESSSSSINNASELNAAVSSTVALMEVTEELASPRDREGMTAITPQSPGFEEMLALAVTSSKKRPRSIWMGSASALNDELDAMAEMESAPNSHTPSSSSSSSSSSSFSSSSAHLAPIEPVASAKSRSSRRRTRIISIDASSVSSSLAMLGEESEAPSAKRRKTSTLAPMQEEAIHKLSPGAPTASLASSSSISVVSMPAPTAIPTPANAEPAPSPRKSLRTSLRKSLRLGGKASARASTHSSVASNNGPLPEIQLYYYMDSDASSVALRKLLASLHFIPREIRNAQNDPMSAEEAIFFAQTCDDIVVVKRSDKAYTVSHKIADLNQAELRALLVNANGEPRSPAIIAGSTYIVGYDKQLKEIFKYYMHRTKKTSTPIRI